MKPHKPLLTSADALRGAGLPDPEPPQRTLPALGSTVIASIADTQLIGAPLCHAPAFVTGYVTDKAKPDDGPVGIEAMILIGNFLSQHLPVHTPQGPQPMPRMMAGALVYSRDPSPGTWRSVQEHAEVAGLAVIAQRSAVH